MSKKLIVLQFRTDVSTEHEQRCFIEKSGLPAQQIQFINVVKDDLQEDPEVLLQNVGAVILGGSGEFDITKQQPELLNGLDRFKPLITFLLENNFPTLGICLGHHIISYFLGAKVEANPDMAENGSVVVTLAENAQQEVPEVFRDIPPEFIVQSAHKESVTTIPSGCIELARSERCSYQSFKYKSNIFTFQYHPELDIDDIIFRLSLYPEYLKKSGKNIQEIREVTVPSPLGIKTLQNFISWHEYQLV